MKSPADELIRKLLRGSDAEAIEAEQALLSLGEEAMPAILKYAGKTQTRMALRTVIPFNLTMSVCGVGGGGMFAVLLARLLHLHEIAIVLLMLPAVIGGIIVAAIVFARRILYPRSERRFVALLAKIENICILPTLLMHSMTFGTSGIEIEEALIRLLPQVEEEGKITLNANQLVPLHSMAGGAFSRVKHRVELSEAALHALSFLGNSSSAAAVRQLLKSKSDFAQNPRIRQAAEQCLERLQAKFDQARGSESLLRASAKQTASRPDELVRPVNHPAADQPDQLLRADPANDTRLFP